MKRFTLSTLSLALLGVAGVAHAQSSVTLYGLIDESFQYVNKANSNGDSLYQLYSGNLQGSRFGLKGTEDLGGGLKAIFQLENGFNVNNGKMGVYNGNSLLFGRQAYVGLTHDAYGTFTAGRQYDPLVDMVQPLTGDNYFGSTFATPGDVDNNDNSSRTSNALKYVSPVFAGFQAEGMYALGGVAGATGSGQSWGGAATYATGPISVAAGYFRMQNSSSSVLRKGWGGTSDGVFDGSTINSAFATAEKIGIASAAVQYVTGPWTANISYSNVLYKPDAASLFPTTERFNVGRAYVGYQVTPAALVGLGYAYTHGNGNQNTSASYNQISLGGDYSISKRTDFYAVGAYQRATGHQIDIVDGVPVAIPAIASIGSYGYSANGNNQLMFSLGIRHKF